MDKPFIEVNGQEVLIYPFEIPEPEGIVFPENFPNCCESHKEWHNEMIRYIVTLPHCCDAHYKFYSQFEFDKNVVYRDFPMQMLKKAFYTRYIIAKNYDKDDWYEDITDYIDFCVHSLGSPHLGLSSYIQMVKGYIEEWKEEFPKEKKLQIFNYLDEKTKITPTKEKYDLNQLYTVYQKWLNSFPFELNFFKVLKEKLSQQLPIIKGKPKVNRYSGLALAKMYTASELIDVLFENTKTLLSMIDTTQYLQQGYITEAQKTAIEVINETHKIKQKALTIDYNKGERKYLKTIKKWLENEKAYFKEIAPQLKSTPAKAARKPKEPIKTFGFKGDDKKLLSVIKSLQLKIDLLKTEHISVEQFHRLLISNDFTTLDIKVHLDCETTQFRYIVKKMQDYFTRFRPVDISESQLFLSSTPSLINSSSLSSANIPNPKEKETIDKIFKEMQ